MFLAKIVQIQEDGARRLVGEFVCSDEGCANHMAGKEIDRLSDFTGLEYDYSVTPVQVIGQ